MRDKDGNAVKPEDYLAAFIRFVRENRDRLDAFEILIDRPEGLESAGLDRAARGAWRPVVIGSGEEDFLGGAYRGDEPRPESSCLVMCELEN